MIMDKLFFKDGVPHAFTELQISEGLADGLYELTDEEKSVLLSDESISRVISVSRAQGKAALIRAGLWQGVLDYVSSIEDATEKALADVALNDTVTWQRTSPLLNEAAAALGLTQERLDDLFVAASGIEL